MATDGKHSYVIFNYRDDGIQWITGDAIGGSNGCEGTPAQVGFNKGDGVNYFSPSISGTSDVVNIGNTSNVGVAGRYVWQVSGATIIPAGKLNCIHAELVRHTCMASISPLPCCDYF